MSEEQLVKLFYNNTLYAFERSSEHSAFRFGGPIESTQRFSGRPLGDRPLHMVASLSLVQMPELWARCRFTTLPLLYGFHYDGCEINYRIKTTSWIEILELWPEESSEDAPYTNYPPLLPYVPLKLAETRTCPYPEFADMIPNMSVDQPAELIVAIPPPATLGVSLWGSGDDACVTVVFECNIDEKTVRAYNGYINKSHINDLVVRIPVLRAGGTGRA